MALEIIARRGSSQYLIGEPDGEPNRIVIMIDTEQQLRSNLGLQQALKYGYWKPAGGDPTGILALAPEPAEDLTPIEGRTE